jgi:hypothetical protein
MPTLGINGKLQTSKADSSRKMRARNDKPKGRARPFGFAQGRLSVVPIKPFLYRGL